MKLKVIVHEAEEGGYWAEVPAIPGCATQGDSFEELLKNLYDAALEEPDVVGICIGTRPDCVDDGILDLLAQYHEKTFLWLEIGLH